MTGSARTTHGGLLRDPAGLWPNAAALAYTACGYSGGWWCLLQPSLALNAVGVLWLGHAMVIAAYLIHDCAHHAIFRNPTYNDRLAEVLNWLTGACYGRITDVRYKHLRHHGANADLISFDYRDLLRRRSWLRRVVVALEWAYVPAVEVLMHGMLLAAPFVLPGRAGQRRRVLAVAAVRGAALLGVGWLAPRALVGYLLAQCLLLTVLRFMDAFQHTYDISLGLDDRDAGNNHRGQRDYEECNTYSNLLSARWPRLNLLTLNFAYHNAHHARPLVGWYRLPRLHAALYPTGCPQQLGILGQLRCFHRQRLARVTGFDGDRADLRTGLRTGRAVGVNALNFLTAF